MVLPLCTRLRHAASIGVKTKLIISVPIFEKIRYGAGVGSDYSEKRTYLLKNKIRFFDTKYSLSRNRNGTVPSIQQLRLQAKGSTPTLHSHAKFDRPRAYCTGGDGWQRVVRMRGRVQAVPENPGAGEDQYQHMLRADKALKIIKLQAGHSKNNM
jgi:hypothetical protein